MTHQGAACDAASVFFGPTMRKTDIQVVSFVITDACGCTEPGVAFGEMALLTDDGTRTASVIADESTDLIVIDRALYERCVQDVIRREFQQKVDFIAQHPQFRHWAPKYRDQLTMSLDKQVMSFDHVVTRQGAPVNALYFIISSVCLFMTATK